MDVPMLYPAGKSHGAIYVMDMGYVDYYRFSAYLYLKKYL